MFPKSRGYPQVIHGKVSDCPWNIPNIEDQIFQICLGDIFIELDDGKNYRKTLYLMVKTMVFCRFSLKPIHWYLEHIGIPMKIYQYLFISLFIGKSSHVLRWSTENVVKTVRIRSAPGRLPVAFLHGHLHQGYSCLKDGGKPVDLGKLCI